MSQKKIEIILQGVDNASQVVSKVAGTTEKALDTVENANKQIEKTNKAVDYSSKEVALAFNNIATSGFALYNAIDRVQDMQVMVDRANLQVKSSLNQIEDAQRRYNAQVEKFGADSPEAVAALKDLELAQERYKIACDRAEMYQGNLNEAMVQSALTVIPSLITMITSISTVTQSWTAITQGASAALNFLQANPIVLVIAGIAALVAALIYAYNNCEWFRNIINTIGAYIAGAFMAAWNAISGAIGWFNENILQPVCRGLEWLWNNILAPLAAFLISILLKAWNDLAGGISWAYEHLIRPVFDAIAWVYNNVLKPVGDFFGGVWNAVSGFFGGLIGGEASNTAGGASGLPGRLQKGGIVTKPMLSLIGEAGPEAVIPLNRLGTMSNNITVTAPLVYVAGSADKKTVEYAAKRVEEILRNVIVEASSSSGPANLRRIRFASRLTA